MSKYLFHLIIVSISFSISLNGQIRHSLYIAGISSSEINPIIPSFETISISDSILAIVEEDSIQVSAVKDCGCGLTLALPQAQQSIERNESSSNCKRKCRETKRQEKSDCKQHKKQFKSCKKAARKTKKACKKSCKAVKKAEIKACKGKRGKAKRRCKKAARKKFRQCKKTCRINKRAAKKSCKTHKKAFRSCKKAARKKAKSCRKACRPVWCCSYCDKVTGPVNKEYRTSRFWASVKCMWNGFGAGSCDFQGQGGGSSLTKGKCPNYDEIFR